VGTQSAGSLEIRFNTLGKIQSGMKAGPLGGPYGSQGKKEHQEDRVFKTWSGIRLFGRRARKLDDLETFNIRVLYLKYPMRERKDKG